MIYSFVYTSLLPGEADPGHLSQDDPGLCLLSEALTSIMLLSKVS
jgi:hypothetical protein